MMLSKIKTWTISALSLLLALITLGYARRGAKIKDAENKTLKQTIKTHQAASKARYGRQERIRKAGENAVRNVNHFDSDDF